MTYQAYFEKISDAIKTMADICGDDAVVGLVKWQPKGGQDAVANSKDSLVGVSEELEKATA